ncbi:MAG: hypothetical protein KC475_02630 [Cyanobacteria bacterium HKST-UBA03]|nr:hypothetical protein [Cyanobacteria bacterium HKST-UBA03]
MTTFRSFLKVLPFLAVTLGVLSVSMLAPDTDAAELNQMHVTDTGSSLVVQLDVDGPQRYQIAQSSAGQVKIVLPNASLTKAGVPAASSKALGVSASASQTNGNVVINLERSGLNRKPYRVEFKRIRSANTPAKPTNEMMALMKPGAMAVDNVLKLDYAPSDYAIKNGYVRTQAKQLAQPAVGQAESAAVYQSAQTDVPRQNQERFNRDASRVSNASGGGQTVEIIREEGTVDTTATSAVRPATRKPARHSARNRAQRYNSREEAQRAASQRSTLRQGQPGSSAVRSVRRDGSFGETPSVDYNAPGVARSVEYQRRVNGPSAASADHVKGDGMTIVGSDGEGGYYDLEGPIDRKIEIDEYYNYDDGRNTWKQIDPVYPNPVEKVFAFFGPLVSWILGITLFLLVLLVFGMILNSFFRRSDERRSRRHAGSLISLPATSGYAPAYAGMANPIGGAVPASQATVVVEHDDDSDWDDHDDDDFGSPMGAPAYGAQASSVLEGGPETSKNLSTLEAFDSFDSDPLAVNPYEARPQTIKGRAGSSPGHQVASSTGMTDPIMSTAMGAAYDETLSLDSTTHQSKPLNTSGITYAAKLQQHINSQSSRYLARPLRMPAAATAQDAVSGFSSTLSGMMGLDGSSSSGAMADHRSSQAAYQRFMNA